MISQKLKKPELILAEAYKDIPGYDGLYQINQYGEVKRIYKSCVRAMKPSIKKGQAIIRLQAPDGSRNEERIHKLMQKTFLPSPRPGQVLYHKTALSWITGSIIWAI